MAARGGPILRRLPRLRMWLWRLVYDYLAAKFQQPHWTFMNYGYASIDGSPLMAVLDPEDQRSERGAELYRRTISDVEVAGRDILEVGSGRGGGCWYVARYLKPRSIVGVDYSANAVELSNRRFSLPGLSFRQGSAEALPLSSSSVDVVVNVESSHCYASMPKFVSEVARVLRPGGHFCIADFRPVHELDALRTTLTSTGLRVIEEADITANVCRSMDLSSHNKELLAPRMVPRPLTRPLRWFFGVKGTGIYDALHDGRSTYRRWVLQKPPDE